MPVGTCSAISAGPLPSITQAMAGDGLVGFCGAANTAPSGLSPAVTSSAEKGNAMGEPTCNGPAGAGGAVVVVAAPGGVGVDPWWRREEVGVGDPEPQAASTSGAANATINPNCSRRPGFPRIARQYGCNGWKVRCTYVHHQRHHL